jgi:2-keto-3-deoxy-L-rhamnonate aldolase RhmA
MSQMKEAHQNFRTRLLAREALVGTFVKTPAPIVCEVLGASELDAVCIDAEHAPFGRLETDACIHALRMQNMPALVRLQNDGHEQILNALDCGATGIVVPHVTSAEQAEAIAKAAHYGRGGRGYAGSSRAASYTGKKMAEHLSDSAAQTTVIAQIEDIEALEVVEDIAEVSGIDCLFIGRIDLTVAYGAESPNDPRVLAAVEKVCRVGRQAGKAVGMFVSDVSEAGKWMEEGASLFLLESDHAFLIKGARTLRQRFIDGD